MYERAAIRERAEDFERASLSTWAVLASESKGRDRYEEPDPLRTAFQTDRDRIVHSASFERLGAKTEAFLAAEPFAPARGWLTRLTHRLIAAQLARTLARGLRLNEDLSETVALAQGLGAPPFGSAGEAALIEVTHGAFTVDEHSLRVVERLADAGRGLNLTWEVRDGILHRSGGADASTLEGQVAALADRLARLLHGLDRAITAGLVHLDDVPSRVRSELGGEHQRRVDIVVDDVVAASTDRPQIACSPKVARVLRTLEEFLAEVVHGRGESRAETDRAMHCLQSVAIFLRTRSAQTPLGGEAPAQALVDHLAGASDGEVLETFTATFRPIGRAGA